MSIVAVFAVMALAFLAIDAIALRFLLYPLFAKHVGDLLREDMQLGVAAGFYVVYVAGLLYFATLPGLRSDSLGLAALNGAIVGLIGYGTYEMTNLATLRGWVWQMAATDIAWGVTLSAFVAVVGVIAGRWLG